MKKLLLKEITIVSIQEGKAQHVVFDPKITIIKGDNGTGKSSLIKSIYYAFGAEPVNMHPVWKSVDPVVLIEFTIDTETYFVMRQGKFITFFDKYKAVIKGFTSVTKGVGDFLAELLNFKIELSDRSGKLVSLPPYYYFLPFYIDQDAGWIDNWCGFEGLGYISGWRDPLIHYHTGIKPKEYYILKDVVSKLEIQISEQVKEKNLLKKLQDKMQDQSESDFNFNMEDFKSEIDELIIEADRLKNIQNKLRAKLVEAQNKRAFIIHQIGITENALKELQADYTFANEVLLENEVECPTCGVVHQNSFVERFQLLQDEDLCLDTLVKLRNELVEIDIIIKKLSEDFKNNFSEVDKIEALLDVKKGEVKLSDILKYEGKKEVQTTFETTITQYRDKLFEISKELEEKQKELKKYTNPQRKQEITDFYTSVIRTYFTKLNVTKPNTTVYKSVTAKVKDTGSELPRALLAYYFAILQVIRKYSSSTFAPIIVDSPNQQDQDNRNIPTILQFISDEQPQDTQLILGLVEDYGVKFSGKVVELKTKNSLLQQHLFKSKMNYVRPFINSASKIIGI